MILQQDLARTVSKEGKTVVFITHDLAEAVALSDRILVMSARPGLLKHELCTGWPRERDAGITANPNFARQVNVLWSVLRDEAQVAMRM